MRKGVVDAVTSMVTRRLEAGLALVRAQIEEAVERHRVPGLSAAIIYDQEVVAVWALGSADLAAGKPATPETVYRVASITKLFTATMLLRLRDQGRLSLDDPLEKHLPEVRFRTHDADPRPVSLRQIASHSAGIPRDLDRDYFGDAPFPTTDELLVEAAGMDLALLPMTHLKYSNVGYSLLGRALERVAGCRYEEYVRRHILEPLGMSSSGFDPTGTIGGHLAQGYTCRPDEEPTVVPYSYVDGMAPTGQLQSSVLDMARFLSLQFRDDPAGELQVLGAATLREMHTPVWMAPDWKSGHCIGWHASQLAGQVVLGHGGGLMGFTSQVCVAPSAKLGVAVFVNAVLANEPWGPETAARGAMETLIPLTDEPATGTPRADTPPEWLNYVGVYDSRYWSRPEVRLVAGKLYLTTMDGKPGSETVLDHVEGRTFCVGSGANIKEPITFLVDDAGRCIGFGSPGASCRKLSESARS